MDNNSKLGWPDVAGALVLCATIVAIVYILAN